MATFWRGEDEALLARLEAEELFERLFRYQAGSVAPLPHPRAAGLLFTARALPGADDAFRAGVDGDLTRFSLWLDQVPLRARPPEYLHHLALFHFEVASALEDTAPEAAANAWTRSLAAWLALAAEQGYLDRLQDVVLADGKTRARDVKLPPERVPLLLVGELGRRAESASRSLAVRGRSALLALSWVDNAVRIAGIDPEHARRVFSEAERARNRAVDLATTVISEAFDEASVRGDLVSTGRELLFPSIGVWAWAGNDASVEHFVADRVASIGWELYRARRWDDLRALLAPFRPMFDSLAARIERDPGNLAYAAGCAQMFVFQSEVSPSGTTKRELAEKALRICPTHRNGRLVLAAILCEEALGILQGTVVVIRHADLARAEELVSRAEKLYPQASDLPSARAALERARRRTVI